MISQIIFQKTHALSLIVGVSVALTVQCQAMERDNYQKLLPIICTKPEYSFGNLAVDSIEDAKPEENIKKIGQKVAWKNNYLLISSPWMDANGNGGKLTVVNTQTKEIMWSEDGIFNDLSFCSQGLEFAATIENMKNNKREFCVYAIKNKSKTMGYCPKYAMSSFEWLSRDEIIIFDSTFNGAQRYKMNLKTAAMSDFLMSKDCYCYPTCVAIRNSDIPEITIGWENEIKIVDSSTGKVQKASPWLLGAIVRKLSWSPDGEKLLVHRSLYVQTRIGYLSIYDRSNLEKPIFVLEDRDSVSKWLNNDQLVTTDGKKIYVQNADDGKIIKTFQKQAGDGDFINDICINSEGTEIASATKSSVDIWVIDSEESLT